MTIITTPTDTLLLEGEDVTGRPLAIATVLVAMCPSVDRPWSLVSELTVERRLHPQSHRGTIQTDR